MIRRGSSVAVALWLSTLALAETPPPPMDFQPKGVTKIVQWAVDPFEGNQAWALSTESLQFNSGLRSGQQWSVKFTKRTYMRIRGQDPGRIGYSKILPSTKKRGNLFLMVEGEGKSQIFFTPDYGESWKYLGARGAARGVPSSSEDGPVDLSNLSGAGGGSPAPSSTTGAAPSGASGAGPTFKIYFDFLMHQRPGINPLTFDNYHYFVLVDFIPKAGIQFSFDLSPTPRFYQLEYEFTNKFALYVGRIMVPFDDMNPHNQFGGYLNNARTAQPNAPAFLPDIWADLGIALRYKLLELSNLSVTTHVYIVNGFQDGGVDPKLPTRPYPNFGALPAPDNNGDKALGARIQTDFFQTVSFAFSFYTGAWTRNPQPSSRLSILGAHARLRPATGTQFKIGYVYFTVDLPAGALPNTFQRGGLYAELRQRFGSFYASIDYGVLQTDDRVADAGDQTVVGGRIGYANNMFDLSLQYRHDLQAQPAKVNRDYTAARLSIAL